MFAPNSEAADAQLSIGNIEIAFKALLSMFLEA